MEVETHLTEKLLKGGLKREWKQEKQIEAGIHFHSNCILIQEQKKN